MLSFLNQVLHRFNRLNRNCLDAIGWNHRHCLQRGIIQALRNRILHERLLQLQAGAGDRQFLCAL